MIFNFFKPSPWVTLQRYLKRSCMGIHKTAVYSTVASKVNIRNIDPFPTITYVRNRTTILTLKVLLFQVLLAN